MKETRIITEKHTFGKVKLYYKNDKLVKKIDYTLSNPLVYTYDNNGELKSMTSIGKKSNKKLWLGVIGTLIILSCLYAKYKSTHHKPIQQINIGRDART